MEGTAKIGLSNDGPSPYINLVDTMLFGGDKTKGKPCAKGMRVQHVLAAFRGYPIGGARGAQGEAGGGEAGDSREMMRATRRRIELKRDDTRRE